MKNQILKIYGLTKTEIEKHLAQIPENIKNDCKISIKEKYLDVSLDIESENEDNIVKIIKQIFDKLKNNIYAEDNQTLYEKLAEIITVRNKKLCIMEQATGGVLSSNLIAIDNVEKHIVSSEILPSVENWLTRYDIDPKLLRENKGISSKLVFSIASAMRRTFIADYYIVALSSDAPGLDVYSFEDKSENHFSIIAIGDNNGVEIYKLQLSGSKRDRNNQTAKSICFKLITELKK